MFRYLKFVIHSDFSLNNVEYVLGRIIDKCLLSMGRKNPEQEVTFNTFEVLQSGHDEI